MADGDFFIGHPEVLLGINPGGAAPSDEVVARAVELAEYFGSRPKGAVAATKMIEYLATTDATGELPLYNPDTYARGLASGRAPDRRSTDGA